MMSSRGDAHKIYKKIKKAYKEKKPIKNLKELDDIYAIGQFYEKLNTKELIIIKYRMEKEKSGSGILPILVSSLPWILFIFSKQLQSWLFSRESSILLWGFIISYISFIMISVILHFREKSWATVHIKILEDIIISRSSHNKIYNSFVRN